MAKGFVVGGGGGGTSSDDLTATKNLVPSGYTYVGKDTDDDPGTGTAPIVQATTYQPKTTNQVIAAGSYLQGAQTIAATTGTAVAADVRLNKTFNSAAGIAVKGTIPDLAGSTITPRNTAQTVASANKYMTGNVVVNGDPNFVAANIKKGVKIWGVTGTWEGYTITNENVQVYNRGAINSGWDVVNDGAYKFSNGSGIDVTRLSDNIQIISNGSSNRIYLVACLVAVRKSPILFTPKSNTIKLDVTFAESSSIDIGFGLALADNLGTLPTIYTSMTSTGSLSLYTYLRNFSELTNPVYNEERANSSSSEYYIHGTSGSETFTYTPTINSTKYVHVAMMFRSGIPSLTYHLTSINVTIS